MDLPNYSFLLILFCLSHLERFKCHPNNQEIFVQTNISSEGFSFQIPLLMIRVRNTDRTMDRKIVRNKDRPTEKQTYKKKRERVKMRKNSNKQCEWKWIEDLL